MLRLLACLLDQERKERHAILNRLARLLVLPSPTQSSPLFLFTTQLQYRPAAAPNNAKILPGIGLPWDEEGKRYDGCLLQESSK